MVIEVVAEYEVDAASIAQDYGATRRGDDSSDEDFVLRLLDDGIIEPSELGSPTFQSITAV